MRTIALRYAENFAPDCGTIASHVALIERYGFVWYGKLGSPVSRAASDAMLMSKDPMFLLIHSGGPERFWAHCVEIQREVPDIQHIPSYYRANASKFGCWFKVVGFERAQKDVMSRCVVASSGKTLSLASRHSMSPYFIIDYVDGGDV